MSFSRSDESVEKTTAETTGDLSSWQFSDKNIAKADSYFDKGSTCRIYKAVWEERTVAVKEMVLTDSCRDACEKEVAMMIKINNIAAPNFITLYGYVLSDYAFSIVMEYAERGSLRDYLDTKPSIDWQTKSAFMKDMLSGINELHKHGIVHKDIKCANFLLMQNNSIKICDFGFADYEIPYSTTVKGTPGWVAPEVLCKHNYTKKADVFSAAMAMYEIASFDIPFSTMNANWLILFAIEKGSRPTIPDDCHVEIKSLIKFGWAQEPQARPTAENLLQQLADINFEPTVRPG